MTTKKKKKPFLWIFLALIILIAGVGVYLYSSYQKSILPIQEQSEVAEFTLQPNSSVISTLKNLEEQELIISAQANQIRLQLEQASFTLMAGDYLLDKSWDAFEMLNHMSSASNTLQDVVSITFVEGKWAKDYAKQIEDVFGHNATETLALWNDETYLQTLIQQYDILTDAILNNQTIVKLEGYLAPQTYEFYRDASVEDITEKILDYSEQIYQENINSFNNSSLTIHEIITLSSMVQFEAKEIEDFRLVASVFLNRLELPMRLESSVTICYALYEYDSWQDCEQNTLIDSPYNTYQNDGLPIGPIANAGKDAILAVIEPVTSDYYFFIADVYGDNTVYYAETFAEHQQNVNTYLRGR